MELGVKMNYWIVAVVVIGMRRSPQEMEEEVLSAPATLHEINTEEAEDDDTDDVPGHALINPKTAKMLESASKFPKKDLDRSVYGNLANLGITDYYQSMDYRRRRKLKTMFRKRPSSESSSSSEHSSSSGSSDYEKNAGNPYTLYKDKYKQNWPWNHQMDGDHMNVNPLAPEFQNQGPSGASLFFGRKWWYFNQISNIIGLPSRPSHLPEAEPIHPGHTLIRPALGMLKSAIKFPHKDLEDGAGVYGNYENLGIRVQVASAVLDPEKKNFLSSIASLLKKSRNNIHNRNTKILIASLYKDEYHHKLRFTYPKFVLRGYTKKQMNNIKTNSNFIEEDSLEQETSPKPVDLKDEIPDKKKWTLSSYNDLVPFLKNKLLRSKYE
ncbi:unnamed protein product [Leptidea sinapis]|uniref:Uncharacterized protein n=1 Tax=Leptidea sinapis TaxID=189913 RepID=A0A5E4QH05_9NEOP|nr:unnamed protein product [Leptidea sinapis]